MKPWSFPYSWGIQGSVWTWPRAAIGWGLPENGATSCPCVGTTALLAAQPEELRNALVEELYPEDRTKQRLLKNQLLQILRDGYCISEGEVDQGVAAVAMPLYMKEKIERLQKIGYPTLQQGLAETVQRLEQKSRMVDI